MKNLKLIALTAATTVTLLGAPFTSMAASSCNTADALKNYGITFSGNGSGNCGNAYYSYNNDTQSIINYLNGRTSDTNTTPVTPTNPGNSGNSNSGSTNSGSTTTSSSQYAQKVVDLVNAERAKEGLSPVSVNTKLENAAQTRAQEIVTSFSHTRPNGSSFGTAIKAAGVSYNACGENIAYGQKSPEAVMNAWMNSSGHRANIMNPNFKYIGVGYYQTNGVNYWVQEFTY